MDVRLWRVLLVEDEFDSVQMLSKILRHYGVEVHVAHNGEECLAMLEKLSPTLVMMDLALPVMDGWETLAEIRANPHWAQLPIVAITAYHSANVAEDALKAGFNAYFSKPIDTANIIRHLGALVGED